ncbi:butyrophilin subfamily 3 member A2-like [Scomber japonicus]|uniref:butyrophilin subfamily 3 member A2-like n=1 Tax=Scomber japonicus TaxID=13676 RepID=UPI002304E472|nr:butyrophilin subfamily 3 member A2-like [Scomber japonicus]
MFDGWYLKGRFSGFMVLLLLTHCPKGQVIGPLQPIVAEVGDDIILPCVLDPPVDAISTAVEWMRPDLTPKYVHVWRAGQDLLDKQNPSYNGRTSVSINKPKHGDILLKLSKVKLSDKGTYRCFIPTFNRESTVHLAIRDISWPAITLSWQEPGRPLLQCESKGWHPQPEVLWLDGEGNLLSAEPTETVRGPDGLYTVSRKVTVEKRHGNRLTCRVQQNNINQTRETHINVPVDFFLVQANSAVRVIICFAVCFMSIAAVVFVMWKWGRNNNTEHQKGSQHQLLMEGQRQGDLAEKLLNKAKQKKGSQHGITPFHDVELHLLMEGQRQGDPTEAEKLLNMKKEKHDEALKSNVEELNHVQNVITTLTEQKKDLKKQREKLTSQLQEVKTKREESKKKLIEGAKLDKGKKEMRRKKTNEELDRRKTELEELLQNTEKLLETTEDLIIRMTERKGKLENDREQIEKQLKATEIQIEEIQRELQSESEEAEKKDGESSKGVD